MLWVWIGTCPRNSSSSAFSLWRRGRGEKRARARVGGDGKEATEAQRSGERPRLEDWGGSRAHALRPRQPGSESTLLGGVVLWGHRPISFLLAPFTSPRPSFPLTRCSLPGHPRPQGASAAAAPPAPAWHVPNSLRGWGYHRRGLKLQRAGGTRPSSQTLLGSPTFSEQLRLAAL